MFKIFVLGNKVIRRKLKSRQLLGIKPRTPGLSCQCSATEPQQPDNHKPSQPSICTAQVVLNASVAQLAATHLKVCSDKAMSFEVLKITPHEQVEEKCGLHGGRREGGGEKGGERE